MAGEDKILIISNLISDLLKDEPEYFLVRVHVRPINHISVYVDGDQGITIEKCVRLNRALYKKIVEMGVCADGEFALEVSSPGVDEPLLGVRQYKKNIGRMVKVDLKEGKSIEGKLTSANEMEIEIEETKGKGKKQEVLHHGFSHDEITSTTVKIIF
jgi:ribosome maturation factor RimP